LEIRLLFGRGWFTERAELGEFKPARTGRRKRYTRAEGELTKKIQKKKEKESSTDGGSQKKSGYEITAKGRCSFCGERGGGTILVGGALSMQEVCQEEGCIQ